MLRRTFAVLILLGLPLWPASKEDTWTGVSRVVAVGDVHGDFAAFTNILRAAAVIDREGSWTGGKTHLVQTGDVLDRGPDSRKVMDLLMSLEKQAHEAGGEVHCLIGNHEAMNLYGDLRYVSAGEFAAFRDDKSEHLRDMYYQQHIKDAQKSSSAGGAPVFDDGYRRKWDAAHPLGFFEHRYHFGPDSDYGKWLRGHNAMIKINDMVFLHGGISPKYAKTKIRDLNREVSRELEDFSKLEGGMVMDSDGPLWYRGLAQDDEASLATHVRAVLERLNATRMVIGHTPTKGAVMPRFEGKVLLIDVGLSQVYGARPACLIVEDGKEYAMHRGSKIELPKNAGTDLTRYLNQTEQLDRAVR